jgi:hypothetical protein
MSERVYGKKYDKNLSSKKGSSREEDSGFWDDLRQIATMLKTGSPVSAVLDAAQAILPRDAVLLLKTRTRNL